MTLGPKGRNVVIEQAFGGPKITKDGVTVAQNIDFKDKFHSLGANLVRSVASKTNEAAGDGTTTATILTRAIFAEGCQAVAANMNPMELRYGITKATEHVVKHLEASSVPVVDSEQIRAVATISANGDTVVGDLIADAMEKVGSSGVITVQNGQTLEHELEHVEGMKFDRGYISPYFITNSKNQKAEMEDSYVLLSSKKISTLASIQPLLEQIHKMQGNLTIIAEDIESEALTTLVYNKVRGVLKVTAVKAPGFGDNRKAILDDIATICGGTVISDDMGVKMESLTLDDLGKCRKVEMSKDDTVITIDEHQNAEQIAARCASLSQAIEDSTSDYEKEKLQERLAKLQSGVCVLKIGGSSEVEVGEVKDRVTDALNATKAAVDEGIVPGGGCALLYASTMLGGVADECETRDQKFGVEIVQRALRAPLIQIAKNAGDEGAVIAQKLLDGGDLAMGYNAAKGEYVNMIDAGIIDPRKVTRTALQDAAGVASLMCTTECMVVSEPEPVGAPPGGGGMPGGMGGMPGMM